MSRGWAIALTGVVAGVFGLYLGFLTLRFAYAGQYVPALLTFSAWVGIVALSWFAFNKSNET
ncbi:MAG: hypothetical protein WBG08_00285 [Litorimonas sp.]